MKFKTSMFGLLAAPIVLGLLAGACGDSVQPAAVPKISLSPANVLFQGVSVGSTDLQPLLIRNEGSGDLVIRELNIRGPGQVFQIIDGAPNGQLTIPPQESRELFLEFAPTGEEQVQGFLKLVHNDPSTQVSGETEVALQVLASDARIVVTPNPISFGRVAAGDRAEIEAAIVNLGNQPLVVTDYFIVGGNDAFQILAESQLSGGQSITLGADERHPVKIEYNPLTSDFAQAALVVRSNDAVTREGNYQVEIFGNGAEPCIEVSPASPFDFGERLVNQTHREPFTIRNCSDLDRGQTLIVTALDLTEDSSVAYALSSVPDLPLTLEPGEVRGFVAEFTPTVDLQVEQAVIDVDSNDTLTPEMAIQLNGMGTNNACPVARATCTVQGSNAPPSTDLLVLPLDTLVCTADGSSDADGEIAEYIWSVVDRPDGSVTTFQRSNTADPTLFIDIVGPYMLNLEVVDDRGCTSQPAAVTVTARSDRDIHVQLVWNTPADPDPTDIGLGLGADLDLHFLHPNGCWNDRQWDVHFRNKQPNWGDPGRPDDDPSLDIDNTDGSGPENINLNNPENGAVYTVAVHYYNDWGYGVSFATVRIYIYGVLVFEARDKEFPYSNFWWVVAAISWPDQMITVIDLVYDDIPSIGGNCRL